MRCGLCGEGGFSSERALHLHLQHVCAGVEGEVDGDSDGVQEEAEAGWASLELLGGLSSSSTSPSLSPASPCPFSHEEEQKRGVEVIDLDEWEERRPPPLGQADPPSRAASQQQQQQQQPLLETSSQAAAQRQQPPGLGETGPQEGVVMRAGTAQPHGWWWQVQEGDPAEEVGVGGYVPLAMRAPVGAPLINFDRWREREHKRALQPRRPRGSGGGRKNRTAPSKGSTEKRA